MIILGVVAAAMAAATVSDYRVTAWLAENQWPFLSKLMGRTLFEGELPGANDPILLLILMAAWVYYWGWKRPATTGISAWRPQSGFVLVVALVMAVFFVHGLKWLLGRARPELVILHGLPFSHWFTFGPHFVTQGIYRGSFPSGHAAQTFILMAAAYSLAGDPLFSRPIKAAGWGLGAVAIIFSLAMGAGRMMTMSHWLTDVIGSIGFGWLLIHLLYFWILRVPDQRRFMQQNDRMPDLPAVWEIRLCVWFFLITLGLMACGIGYRGVFLNKGIAFSVLVPVGIALIWIGQKQALELWKKVTQVLKRAKGAKRLRDTNR